MITLVLVSLLLLAAYSMAPGMVRIPMLIFGGITVVLVAFTSVELSLYLLILSTLLSPELSFGGGGAAAVAGHETTTQSRGVTLRLDDILLSIICLTWLFRMAIFKELGTVRQTPINQPIAWYWLATAFATLAGFYSGRVGMYGFFFVLKYLEYFVVFYMIINQLHDEGTIRRYLMVMLLTCMAASLAGIAQIPSGARVSAPFEGEVGEPNTFGGYLTLMFSVVLGIFLHVQEGYRRLWLSGLMLVILIPFVFTESRSSYLAFMAAMLLFLVYSQHKRLLMVMFLAGLILIPFALPQNVVDRVMYTFNQSEQAGQMKLGAIKVDTSTSERLKSWQNVLEHAFPRHPLLGVGVTGGGFLDAQYPRVLLETGIIGLVFFLWLLRRIWVLLRQCYAQLHDPIIKGASLGTLCGFGGLLVHAIGSNSFIIVRIMEPLMILLGLLLAALMTEQARSREKGKQGDLQEQAAG
jgi:hypothetical protein